MANFQVQIKFIGDTIGKGLFASHSFKEGEVMFEEDPLVSCQFSWNRAYKYLSCDLCLRPLESAEENAQRLSQNSDLRLPYPELCEFSNPGIKCSFCDVPYCSEECMQKSWNQYHKSVCVGTVNTDPNHPLVLLEETWKNMHYPPESASVMLLVRIFASVCQSSNKEEMVSRFMSFCHKTNNEDEEIAHKLLGPEFSEQIESLRRQMQNIFSGPEVQHWLTPSGFRSLFALVGTNGQGIGTSSLSEWVRRCEALDHNSPEEHQKLDSFIESLYDNLNDVAGCFLNNEGSGLYSLQSACNHSCDPNAVVTFPHNSSHLVVKALRNIPEGEEISISYLDDCELHRSRHSRSKTLRENYLFTCRCPKCLSQADDPDLTSDEEMESEEESDDEI